MTRLLEALRSGQVLLMDGAMGTQLLAAGVSAERGLDIANIEDPERVLAVHRAYVAAGARVLLTNTFQANPTHLRKFGLGNQLGEIVRAAVALARCAVGDAGFVLGDLGPSEIGLAEIRSVLPYYHGVDGYLIETASDTILLERVRNLLNADGAMADLPVLFSATYLESENGIHTYSGHSPTAIARRATDLGAAALGLNCGNDIDMTRCAAVLAQYRRETALPLFARPNAGTPKQEQGRWEYPFSADTMATGVERLIHAGAVMMGGCCGTTPAHIACCAEKVRLHNAKRAKTAGD